VNKYRIKRSWFFEVSRLMSWATVVIILLPLVVMVTFSFNPELSFYPRHFVLKWYLLNYEEILGALRMSLFIALPAVLVSFCISLPLCYALVRREFKLKEAVTQAITLPMIIPGTVMGFAFLQLFNSSVFRLFHPLLVLVLAHTVVVMPFMARAILGGLERFDITLEEAAITLGSSPFKAFFVVTLPMTTFSVLAGVVLSIARSLNDFIITLFLIQPKFVPLGVHIYKTTMYGMPQLTSAASTVLLSLSLGLALIAERIMKTRHRKN